MKSFDALWSELEGRAVTRPDGSGSVAALDNGTAMIAKKVLEEAGEVFAAANHESDDALATEISQLIYWTQLLAISRGLSRRDIEGKL